MGRAWIMLAALAAWGAGGTHPAHDLYGPKVLLGMRPYVGQRVASWGWRRGLLSGRQGKFKLERASAGLLATRAGKEGFLALLARNKDGSAVERLELDPAGRLVKDSLLRDGPDAYAGMARGLAQAKKQAGPQAFSLQGGCCGKAEAMGLEASQGGHYSALPLEIRRHYKFEKIMPIGKDAAGQLYFASLVRAAEGKPGHQPGLALVKASKDLEIEEIFLAGGYTGRGQSVEDGLAVDGRGAIWQLDVSPGSLVLRRWVPLERP